MSAGEPGKEGDVQMHIASSVLERQLYGGGGGLDLESSATGELQRETTCAKNAQVDVLTRVVMNLINRRNP